MSGEPAGSSADGLSFVDLSTGLLSKSWIGFMDKKVTAKKKMQYKISVVCMGYLVCVSLCSRLLTL